VRVHTGTSGYNYAEWRGRFYPERMPPAAMLEYYASQFQSVEINASFYRMPTAALLDSWAARVPETFTFSLKAPRRLTHDRRLKDCAEPLRAFCDAAATLGPRLGVLLFQLPPNFKVDVDRLSAFLELLPPGARAAFEFRHESWWDAAVFDLLRARNVALCVADSEDRRTPLVATASFGYLRLRDEGYTEAQLGAWAGEVVGQAAWSDAFVYFKHEDDALGPEFAQRFRQRLQESSR
jgi:uncharacterized protein YecE (DUF72 family)